MGGGPNSGGEPRPGGKRRGMVVSQELFEACVLETMEELEMNEEEARACAKEQLLAQGLDLRLVDVSGQWASRRSSLEGALSDRLSPRWALDAAQACRDGPSSLAVRAVEVAGHDLVALLHESNDTEVARASTELLVAGSSASIVDALGAEIGKAVLHRPEAFSVAAACAKGRECVKADLLKTAGFIEAVVAALPSSSAALRATVAADDLRSKASGSFEACRRYVECGAVPKLVQAEDLDSLRLLCKGESQCKAIAQAGGLDLAHRALGDRERRADALGLLRNLAHSDDLKSKIHLDSVADAVEYTLVDRDCTSCERALAVIASSCLRRPDLAERCARPDLFVDVFDQFPDDPKLLRQACLCIRNLVARNPDHVPLFKPLGEALYAAAAKHPTFVLDVAYAALRDLGFDCKITTKCDSDEGQESKTLNFRPVFDESQPMQELIDEHTDYTDQGDRNNFALL